MKISKTHYVTKHGVKKRNPKKKSVLSSHHLEMRKPEIKDVRVGMVFRMYSRKYDTTLFCRVTSRPYFDEPGDRPDIFYAVFVNPNDFSRKRLVSDREFAVWDFDYRKSLDEHWVRIK